jgi:hypothetical protein
MDMIRLAMILLFAAGLAPAQRVGTAFRTVTLAPEEISVEMVLATPPDTLLEQALSVLTPLGVTAKDLKTVGTMQGVNDRIGWQFSIARPYYLLDDTLKRLDRSRRELPEPGLSLSYQFFLRASPKTIDTMRRRVLGELLSEAKRSSGGGGKLRSVIVEPTPETVESGRAPLLFGQASAPLQYNFSVIAFFEDE